MIKGTISQDLHAQHHEGPKRVFTYTYQVALQNKGTVSQNSHAKPNEEPKGL
jgi:hypothetical protein